MLFVDGRDAGLEMIRQGLAWVFQRYLPEAPEEQRESQTK
jgi:endonuclease YncB( thermonuclease family)